MFLLGDSAGGNLAAGTAQIARDRGAPRSDGQILIYPSVAGDVDGASMHAFVPPLMGRDEIAAYYDLYVPDRTDRRGDCRPCRGEVGLNEGIAEAAHGAAGRCIVMPQDRKRVVEGKRV